MNMPGLPELVALAILALLIFGPDRLPGIVHNLGKAVGTIRREAHNALNDFKSASDYEDVRTAARELRGEAESLRREGREVGRDLRRVVDEPARQEPSSPEAAAAGDGPAAPEPVTAGGDRATAQPAPFDPDVP